MRDLGADRAALQAIHAAATEGDHSRAVRLAEAALADGLEHPLLFNLVALKLEKEGRMADAERLLRRAVHIAPEDTSARNAFGLCLLSLDRPGEALEQFDELLKLNPSLPFGHTSRGNALLSIGAVADAEASYQNALKIDPRQGIAWAGLARIASGRGAYPEARALAEKALGLMPGYPDAVMSLASAELGQGRKEAAADLVRALLGASAVAPLERAHAQGLLGDILDAQGRPLEAFEAYRACNDALRTLYAPSFAASGAREYVHSMTGYFEQINLESSAAMRFAVPSPVRKHVFLLGFPRSGTTLLEAVLEGHPGIVSLEEKELLIDSVREFMGGIRDIERLCRAPAAALDAMRAAYWSRVAQAGAEVQGKVFVDKHPLNTLKLPLIARLFPDAKILFACRDPRDIVLSCFRHRFRMTAPIYELLTIEGAARYYDAVMRLLVRLNGVFTLDSCTVRHEDVVTEFVREMKRVCAFLHIDWSPAMGDFALRSKNRSWLTPSTAQLVRGLNTEGVGQWRRYRFALEPVLDLLDPWVKRFYYDP